MAAGEGTARVVVSPDGASVYATNRGTTTVSQYSRNPETGNLTPLSPPTVAAEDSPEGIVVSPDGKNAYVANNTSAGTVSQFARNTATGALTAMSPATVEAGNGPIGLAISPDGRNVYAANSSSATVSQYSRNTETGKLTPLAPPTLAAGVNAHGILISPGGGNVYATNYGAGTVSQYSRNAETGRLTALSPATVPAGINPHDLAISPDGKSLYVANNASLGTLSQFTRNTATGALTAMGPATIAAGEYTECVVVGADGTDVYATNEVTGDISQYARNTETGALTAQPVPTIPTEPGPEGIAMSADGESLYVANHGSARVSQYGRASPPAAVTGSAGAVGETSATASGSLNPNGQTTTYHFDYGLTTAYGAQAPAPPDSGAGSGIRARPLSVDLVGLTANTTYHFRIVATSPAGKSYGADQMFTTLSVAALPVPVQQGLPTQQAISRGALPDEHEAPPLASARVVSASLSVSPSGWVSVKMTCPAGNSGCSGTVTLHTLGAVSPSLSGYRPRKGKAVVLTLASGSFTLAAGQARGVTLHLSVKGRALLARTHVLRVRASIIARGLAGDTNTTQTIVTLRAPNSSHRHGRG